MFDSLFNKQPKFQNDFDVSIDSKTSEKNRGDVNITVYVLGSANNSAFPDEGKFYKLPPIGRLSSRGYHVNTDIRYMDNFAISCKSHKNAMINAWNSVLDIFKNASEKEIDNIVLVGLTYPPIMAGRKIFLEEVQKAVVKSAIDLNRYERIRKRLEFYAPSYNFKEFFKWFLV